MLKKYSWLYVIMLVSLLGLVGLHSYFAYQDYQAKEYEYQQQVNLSFEEAVAAEKEARIDTFIAYTRSLFADSSKVEIRATYNEEKGRTHFSLKDTDADSPYTSLSYEHDKRKLNHLDSLNFEITLDYFMESVRSSLNLGTVYYWTQDLGKKMHDYLDSTFYDERLLGEIFQEKLNKRNIRSSFEIREVAEDSLEHPEIAETDFQTEAFQSEFPGRKVIPVIAIMKNPAREIFGRIKLTLIGAVLNLILVGLSFLFLLKVIFKQKKLSQIKDDFIDNITHELQTPIATLMAANEAMSTYHALEDPEKSKRYLSISNIELRRLSSMVDNILMSSIHNRSNMALKWERVDVQDLIKLCIFKNELKSDQQVKFELDLQEGPLELHTDKLHLQNILDNLIENAVKYNDAEIKIIKISSGEENGQVQITVTDNGNGIPEDQQEQIFEKFYRIPSDVGKAKGFGIGLYYIKTILEQLKGQINVQPAQARGTSFILSFPLDSHE